MLPGLAGPDGKREKRETGTVTWPSAPDERAGVRPPARGQAVTTAGAGTPTAPRRGAGEDIASPRGQPPLSPPSPLPRMPTSYRANHLLHLHVHLHRPCTYRQPLPLPRAADEGQHGTCQHRPPLRAGALRRATESLAAEHPLRAGHSPTWTRDTPGSTRPRACPAPSHSDPRLLRGSIASPCPRPSSELGEPPPPHFTACPRTQTLSTSSHLGTHHTAPPAERPLGAASGNPRPRRP